jgi:SPP1 gp7 family putative phage head morphogenesis protein
MPTANELLLDATIEHSVHVERFSNSTARKIIARLNLVNERLARELQEAIDKMPQSTFRIERLESLLFSVNKTLKESFGDASKQLQIELEDFAKYEASYQEMILKNVLPAQVSVASISGNQVYAAAMSRPFQGVMLRDSLEGIDAVTRAKIRQTISAGIIEGRTTAQIVRDIRGSRGNKYADGLMEKSRRDVETIVRTSISHVASVTRGMRDEENADIIKALKWVSTLDLRTSSQCRLRDNKLYTPKTHKPIGHSIPWLAGAGNLHFNCRSVSTPVLKSFKELGIDMEGSANISTTRASLDGQVPQDKSYADWIKQQSFERQVEVLGVTRAKLLRDGGLKMEDLYSQKGQYLTLDELKSVKTSAFKKTGL